MPAVLSSSTSNAAVGYDAAEYDSYSRTYNALDGGDTAKSIGIEKLRQKVGAISNGNVLETAIGTGIQLLYYDWDRIERLTGIDLSQGMLDEAKVAAATINSRQKEASPSNQKITLRPMDATKLQFNDRQFDTVVDTFSLCVIDDPTKAVKEMVRVAKPDAKIVLLENLKSSNALMGLFQDITEPFITPTAKGCRWNVNVRELAEQNGLALESSDPIAMGTLSLNVYRLK
jgi:ubiquinone/menaquinone biosynthesis C-methylase UbiE